MTNDDTDVADIGLQALAKQLRDLPREIAPRRALWPEIEARISHTDQEPARTWPQRWMPIAMAASLLLAVSALGLSVHTSMTLRQAAPPETASVNDALGAIDRGYSQVRLDYLRDLAGRDSELDPETCAVLRENLRIIEAASDEIRAALGKRPGDPLLLDAMESVTRNEIDVLAQLAVSRPNMI